jgi:pimeloyl-ACP methyl ester carboxylesterase
MDHLLKKSVVSRRSFTYGYYVSPGDKFALEHPALIFIHGWPDSAYLWSEISKGLSDLPNKLIFIDCLGYASTDKPQQTSFYSYQGQADDVVDILRNENVKSAIVVGHDWGSVLAQRVFLHHRELFVGVVLVNAGYMVPTDQRFDLEAVNNFTKETIGHPQFAYWDFFANEDAASVIDPRLERLWQVLHGNADDWLKRNFCNPGAMRKFLEGNEDVPLKPYAQDPKWRDHWIEQFKQDGMDSTFFMYRAMVTGVQSRSDFDLVKGTLSIDVPLLFIFCSKDTLCPASMMSQAKQENLVPKLTEVEVDAAHWSPMEKPHELVRHIKMFMTDTF